MGLADSNKYQVPSALNKEEAGELIEVGTSKGHWPDLFYGFLNCNIVLKIFLSLLDYGPLLPILHLQDCTKSLPFTHALHNFFFNYM
jgi:hypothetical protein